MFNPDGSEFERSGNGLRILGAYLFSRGRVGVGEPFLVEVGGGEVTMEILGGSPAGHLEVAVAMGRARFGMEAVGGAGSQDETTRTISGPGGAALPLSPVSVGNPHCVVFREELAPDTLRELGPFLTSHPLFPKGVNVQLARVSGPARVEILIWERGVGETSSSGTSACAVASACVHQALLSPGTIEVVMEGGSFHVTVSPGMDVRLEGPVQPLLDGELREEILGDLRSGPGS
jgi:diaminopimelate epimerase